MKKVLVVLCLASLLAPAMGQELAVPITVQDAAGVARVSEPASGGIPLPWGKYQKDQGFALFEGDKEVPAQAIPLVVDEKGFLRWVLLDFQADLAAKEKRTYTLKTLAPKAKPAQALKVTDGTDGVTVDTGKIKFTISKSKPFSLLSAVEAGGKAVADGGEASYTDSFDGKRYVADKPASVQVEYQGPMRTTICAKGRFVGDDQTQLRYIARITAWAGRSDVHVKYSLSNSNEEHYTWRRIKDSSIEMKLAGSAAGAIVGAGKPAEADAPCWIQQSSRVVKAAAHGEDNLGNAGWLHATPGATGPGGAKAMSGDKELWVSAGKGDVAEGWIAARVGGALVAVNDLYFVEDPARRLTVNKNSIVLTGVAEPLEGAASPFGDRHRWILDSSHLTSQYVIDFQAPAAVADLSARAKAVRSLLHAMAPPAWYFETEGLAAGKIGTQEDELACYKKWNWAYDDKEIPRGPGGRIAVMPRWSGGDDNHYTSEQDTLDGLLLMYLRTGYRSFFDASESWANYFMDLQGWRTDGWKFKDGGVWWTSGGPLGNSPQRGKDPVTGLRNGVPAPWTKEPKEPFNKQSIADVWFQANAKACYCHNWGEGIAGWFCITGDRDALETAVDCVEQNFDTQKRAFRKTPGKPSGYSRDFTRACYLSNATRLCDPSDPFVTEASDYLAQIYLQRPNPEPRGFLNGPSKIDMKALEQKVGPKGLARMKELGVTLDEKTGEFSDPKTGAKWMAIPDPHTWMFPPLSKAMEVYYRITGNDDVHDWVVAYGQAAAYVLYQQKHGNLSYSHFLADFPTKGFAWDRASWDLPDDSKDGEGVAINGYLAQFYPDVPARAYSFTGEPFLKQRAHDFWYYGSHRGYNASKMHNIGKVGKWINVYSTHDESVTYTGKTIYEWSHERKDAQPPKAVADLAVKVEGDKATVTFTAPADEGGGKVVRYQVKCSDKPTVSYEDFLKAWAANKDAEVLNWWMAKNLNGEPAPAAAGKKESFTVTGVPQGMTCFTVVSVDDSSNRSPMSNVAKVQ